MKYKVGDKVKVRSDLRPDGVYTMDDGYDPGFGGKMLDYTGIVATIVRYSDGAYKLDIDGKYWDWADGMLEGLAEEETEENDNVEAEAVMSDYEAMYHTLKEKNESLKMQVGAFTKALLINYNLKKFHKEVALELFRNSL